MKYQEITIFELSKRKKRLEIFRENIEEYFEKITYDEVFGSIVDTEQTIRIRERINKDLNLIYQYLSDANVSCLTDYSPPGTTSFTENIDIFFNIFQMSQLNTSHQMTVDLINRGIGIYESEETNAKVRTFNPLWWFWKIVKLIIRAPFLLLSEAGFNSEKFESSLFGKLLKLILEIAVGVCIAYIVYRFGWNK